MQIVLAEHAGFCFGVQKAVDTVYRQIAAQPGPIYTYGPIIHNENVVRDLAEKGVQVIPSQEALAQVHEGTVIIRSHGATRAVFEQIAAQGLRLIDATCPFVKRIHRIVAEESAKGRIIVVFGDPSHPEVEGIVSYAEAPVYVLRSEEEACAFRPPGDDPRAGALCVVAQTTYNYNKFQEAVEIFKQKEYNCNTVNTICSATQERQTETEELAKKADVMIVIGGAHSSNTRKLFEIANRHCKQTYFIQTLDDLHLELPKAVNLVGITAGASTPKNIIEEVQTYVRARANL